MILTDHTNYRIPTLMTACVVFLALFFLGACTSGLHGGLQRSAAVSQGFRTYTAASEYRYYHSGWSNNPYAIIAINPDYTLKDRLWTRFTPTSETLKKLMNALYDDHNLIPYGAYILDHRGNRIGIWYSAIQWAAVMVDDQTHTVDIIPDTPYLNDERRIIGHFQVPSASRFKSAS